MVCDCGTPWTFLLPFFFHLLTDGQKKQRVKVAKQLLKIFPKYDEKKYCHWQ